MISVRINGSREECEAFTEMLSEMFSLTCSAFIHNRSGKGGRIYAEIPKEEFMGSVDSLPGGRRES